MNAANISSAHRLGGRFAAAGDWLPRDLFCDLPGSFILQWSMEAGFAAEMRNQETKERLYSLANQFQSGYSDAINSRKQDQSGWSHVDMQFAYLSGYSTGYGVMTNAE